MRPLKPNNTVGSSCSSQGCFMGWLGNICIQTRILVNVLTYLCNYFAVRLVQTCPYIELFNATYQHQFSCRFSQIMKMPYRITILLNCMIWILFMVLQPVCSSTLPVTGKNMVLIVLKNAQRVPRLRFLNTFFFLIG